MTDEDFEDLANAHQAAKQRMEMLGARNMHGLTPVENAIQSAKFNAAAELAAKLGDRLANAARERVSPLSGGSR